MSSTDDVDLVREFWEHHRRAFSADRSDRLRAETGSWASDAVDDAVMQPAENVVGLLVKLAEGVAGDEDSLMFLGAGPIESLLVHHGGELPEAMLDEIEAAARQNPSFRMALRGVSFRPASDDPRVVNLLQKYGRTPP